VRLDSPVAGHGPCLVFLHVDDQPGQVYVTAGAVGHVDAVLEGRGPGWRGVLHSACCRADGSTRVLTWSDSALVFVPPAPPGLEQVSACDVTPMPRPCHAHVTPMPRPCHARLLSMLGGVCSRSAWQGTADFRVKLSTTLCGHHAMFQVTATRDSLTLGMPAIEAAAVYGEGVSGVAHVGVEVEVAPVWSAGEGVQVVEKPLDCHMLEYVQHSSTSSPLPPSPLLACTRHSCEPSLFDALYCLVRSHAA
jgi:hypothetical protein